MKRFTISMLVLFVALLSACASSTPQASESDAPRGLLVSGAATGITYTRADLEAMPVSEASFKDVNYKGVTVSALLQAAGFDLSTVKAVKAIASDGFSVNYETSQVLGDDVIVAYATIAGDLAEEDGDFRMVLPGAEGKLNVRMLVELQVIQ